MGRTRTTGDALGFQVRRDIQNKPLREVDRDSGRQLWSTAVVVVAVLGVLFSIAVVRQRQINLGYELEQLRNTRRSLEMERRHLQAEKESLLAPGRIERLAIDRLKLVAPTDKDAFVIQRVRTSPTPSPAVVARR